jgi:hypothetical protein
LFSINLSWLFDVAETYRFDFERVELVEIVRALDVVGAEKRLKEYEAVLHEIGRFG